jgi:transposase-like protein
MEFPITELLDHESSLAWLIRHFHPGGFDCAQCGAPGDEARCFRETARSQLLVYRCTRCDRVYNVYTGTVFQQSHLTPPQVVLLLRGVSKGEPTTTLAKELGVSYPTVLKLRHALQANGTAQQPHTALPDRYTETDEMFQNAGEKK